ncbi:MAG: rhomboid family intramembrane serine protease [Chloroflexi bacterium]|nr:MAG: rhomboid family intramembrane serine protease [Chloroflexota bacterium]
MIPLHDLNPTRRFPLVTYLLIGINVVVFFWQQRLSEEQLHQLFLTLSVVPANVAQAPFSAETLLDMVRSMFFHGNLAHLLGNMLYLYLFGDNLEDRLGVPLYLLLYFVSGFAAGYAQVLVNPASEIPLVGASGAISGVLGGYLLLFPGVEVRGIIPIGYFFHTVRWPAWVVLGMWFVIQLLYGLLGLGAMAEGGVAFFAHVGGFVAGLGIMAVLMPFIHPPPRSDRYQMLYDRASRYRF